MMQRQLQTELDLFVFSLKNVFKNIYFFIIYYYFLYIFKYFDIFILKKFILIYF